LSTSIDPFVGHGTKWFCFIKTGCCFDPKWKRSIGPNDSEDDVDDDEDNEKLNGETSESSGELRVVVDDEENEDDDFERSNTAVAAANYSGLKALATEESKDDEDVTQSTSMLQNPDTDLGMYSDSLKSDNDNGLSIAQTTSDVQLNRNNSFVVEPPAPEQIIPHTFPRKPDFLDMCCAGDPLEVEKHLEFPEVKLQKVNGTRL
jgi:hypothetical protein